MSTYKLNLDGTNEVNLHALLEASTIEALSNQSHIEINFNDVRDTPSMELVSLIFNLLETNPNLLTLSVTSRKSFEVASLDKISYSISKIEKLQEFSLHTPRCNEEQLADMLNALNSHSQLKKLALDCRLEACEKAQCYDDFEHAAHLGDRNFQFAIRHASSRSVTAVYNLLSKSRHASEIMLAGSQTDILEPSQKYLAQLLFINPHISIILSDEINLPVPISVKLNKLTSENQLIRDGMDEELRQERRFNVMTSGLHVTDTPALDDFSPKIPTLRELSAKALAKLDPIPLDDASKQVDSSTIDSVDPMILVSYFMSKAQDSQEPSPEQLVDEFSKKLQL